MAEARIGVLSPRVREVTKVIQGFDRAEMLELLDILLQQLETGNEGGGPHLRQQALAIRERLLEQARYEARPPSADDTPFVAGLTWGEYMALSEEEQEHIWNAQFTMDIDDFEEHDVRPDAYIPARQEHRP